MLTYIQNKIPQNDEMLVSVVGMDVGKLFCGSLRKELVMATLRKRRGSWYARVQWWVADIRKEKSVPLKTQIKVIARERLAQVNKVESDIKSGMNFTFPWLSGSSSTTVKRFKLNDAVELWLSKRKSKGIRSSTIKRNRYSMASFMSVVGYGKPLSGVTTNVIDTYTDVCINKGMTADGININLRGLKTFLRWCHRRAYLNKVPHIDMVSKPKSMPLYLPDGIFKQLIDLEWLDSRYKDAFKFYLETGCRASEPFIGELDGNWLLISADKTKQRADKELHLNNDCLRLYNRMRNQLEKYSGTVTSWTENLSKTFLKAMREVDGDDTKYHLHCLRHTYAVRRYLQTRDIYLVKQEMGHASVTTTEVYAQFSLRRLEMDFPSLVGNQKMSEISENGHGFDGHKIDPLVRGAVAF